MPSYKIAFVGGAALGLGPSGAHFSAEVSNDERTIGWVTTDNPEGDSVIVAARPHTGDK